MFAAVQRRINGSRSRPFAKNVLIILSMVFMIFFIVFSVKGIVAYADDDEIKDYSWAKRAQQFMTYYNQSTVPETDGKIGGAGLLHNWSGDETVVPGNTGVFVAYDEGAEDGVSGWITTKVSMASYSHGYEQYFAIPTDVVNDGDDNYYHGVYVYARYGRTLAAMGFDTTSGDSNFSMGRTLSGAPIIIAYMLSVAVPSLFHIVIEVLRALNPFSLFFSTIKYDKIGDKGAFTFGSSASTGKFTNTNADNNGALSDVADALRDIYAAVQDLSLYALIPLFMAFAIAGFLLFRKNQNGEYAGRKIKMTVIRLAFIVMGMPLLGSVYTSVLENMSKKISVGGSATSKMVLSTFVDFEAWASNTRLAPPDVGNAYIGSIDASKDVPCGVVDEVTLSHLRELCARINVASGSVSGLVAYSQIQTVAQSGDIDNWDSSNASIKDSSTISSTDILNVLYRYYENEFYLAGAYESKAKSDIQENETSASNYAIYAATNNASYSEGDGDDDASDLHTGPNGTKKCYMNGSPIEVTSKLILRDMYAFGDGGDNASKGYNPFANGGLSYSDAAIYDTKSSDNYSVPKDMHFTNGLQPSLSAIFETRSVGSQYFPSDVPDKYREEALVRAASNYSGLSVKDVGGLSSMSLYNYLNTEFKVKEIICYSTDSASNFVRKQHHSVNLIGTGVTSFLYWFNLLCLCGGMAVIGFGYAFAIIVSNIRRSWQIIFNMPLAMMGALQAIAKMIVYTIVMIIEIIGTIFMYTIMEEFMYGVATIVEKPFNVELQNASSAIILPTNSIFAGDDVVTSIGDGITCAGGFSSTVTVSLMLLLSSFLLIWITVNAFRFRKSFVKSVDEMCAKVVNKFVVGNDAGLPSAAGGGRHNSGPGLAPALAQGAAQGMMMHNLDKKDGDKDKDKNKDVSENKDSKSGSSGSSGKDGAAGSDTEHDTDNNVEAGESAETASTDSDSESENSEFDNDNAAMDAESADDTGHTDSDDKAVAAAMDGSPTENKNVDVSADNDKVVNAASGDKSVEATNVDNSSMQDNTSVDDRDNTNTVDNEQSIEHAVEAGDAAAVAGAEAAATVDSAMHGVDADGDADSNSGAGDSQSNANLADKEVADATGDHSVRADANPRANAGGSSTGNADGSSSVHGVGAGDKPFGKRAQRLQAKYDRQNNKAEQKAVKKDVSAAEKSARKEENRMIKANTAATQKANAAERKANKDLTAASMNAAKSKKAMAQNQLREARSAYRAAMDGNDKQKQAQAKENLIKARKDFTQANQSAKVASAEHRTASRMAKDSHIAMSNMATGAQGMIQRMDNSTKSAQMAVKGAGQTVANKSKAAANKAAPVVKTAGKVAGTTAKVAGVTAAVAVGTTALAAAAAAKTAENIYDTTVDDSF